jgi:hypothetical protein
MPFDIQCFWKKNEWHSPLIGPAAEPTGSETWAQIRASSDKANRRTQGNATMWPVTALSVC